MSSPEGHGIDFAADGKIIEVAHWIEALRYSSRVVPQCPHSWRSGFVATSCDLADWEAKFDSTATQVPVRGSRSIGGPGPATDGSPIHCVPVHDIARLRPLALPLLADR